MATSSSNNEWLQFYQNNLAGPPPPTPVQWSGDSVTTTAGASSVSNQLNRVTRPTITRRRPRASRRTPTTLLNTDTANFRAMVQQLTGGGAVTSGQFLSTYDTSSSGCINYGMGSGNSVASLAAAGGYNVGLRQPYHRQFQRTAVDDGGADGVDGPPGFVERVQDGGMLSFSGENVNGGKNPTSMF